MLHLYVRVVVTPPETPQGGGGGIQLRLNVNVDP